MSCQVNADTAIGTFCSVSLRRFAVTTVVPSVETVPEFSVDFVVFWSGGAFCACASGAPSSAAAIAAERSENPLRLVFMDHPPEIGDEPLLAIVTTITYACQCYFNIKPRNA